ncbi:MAG: F0F1 ATP synthase subunit gamma [Candidatus Puniceispirillaceae bacterium]|jgi:F-type H+-transporting ATPase subunit gamma|nr:F0F1 ATP synthase subunit gamma [SAR116 cluster bacterium]MEC7170960.1 F0F1 ATP synthase subunit gamma [Pseudomonadota bacterium]GIS12191.1 MAG: ATP synthase gamma chain [Alphaproteobacteria bacterium]MCH2563996.1 F0F1 ATP synthase subunit gamma [SAR116 cluster bacterium]MEC7371348.1 F0F1 ATP synthase subunit gamma [Pseudomonadota bacterium]|tara:strand:- start:1932 stop:2807 length:876 start_codon:yes stop_codon:yes gene_type:complete
MPSLKDLKTRINSVKSTQKITSAMKMVAAAKLRRAQDSAEKGRPYADRMQQIVNSLASKADPISAPQLLVGNGKDNTHLLVVVSADRGLCGGFNGAITRQTRTEVARLRGEGKTVKLLMVGRKSADALRRELGDSYIDSLEGIQGTAVEYADAASIGETVRNGFEAGEFDVCTVIFNKFKSAISQEVTLKRLIPAEVGEDTQDDDAGVSYEYEPDEEELLAAVLPRNISTQVYSALLESSAAELAARMTAMDNATRNAGDLIERLTLVYNRTRQATITKELIEIISGAEAV